MQRTHFIHATTAMNASSVTSVSSPCLLQVLPFWDGLNCLLVSSVVFGFLGWRSDCSCKVGNSGIYYIDFLSLLIFLFLLITVILCSYGRILFICCFFRHIPIVYLVTLSSSSSMSANRKFYGEHFLLSKN